MRARASVGGQEHAIGLCRLKSGLDAHCEHGSERLAPTLIQEPADQFYGERQYLGPAIPEGHVWTFTQPSIPPAKCASVRDCISSG